MWIEEARNSKKCSIECVVHSSNAVGFIMMYLFYNLHNNFQPSFSPCDVLIHVTLFCPQFHHDKVQFPEHLPISTIQRGIKSGKYLQGSFMASRENYMEGNVSVKDEDNMVRFNIKQLLTEFF